MLTITISTKAALIFAALFAVTAAAVPWAMTRADGGAPDSVSSSRVPVATAFQFQGRLELDGVPANGTHQLAFTLYSDPVANAVVGNPITYQLEVTNGLFSVPLDFGVEAFNGDARWLGIEALVGNAFVPMPPRQQLRATPYAIHSLTTGPHSHFGETWSGSDSGNGFEVVNSAPFAAAISGQSTGGVGNGVSGTGHLGVVGIGTSIGVRGAGPTGVKGESQGGEGFGVHGVFNGALGTAVRADANGEAVAGMESIVTGEDSWGIYASASGQGSTGIFATGSEWAGDFSGWIRVSSAVQADDVLPTPGSCSSGGCFIGDTSKAWTAVYAAAYPAVSDARKKANITGLPYGLAEILALRPVSYSFIDDEAGKTRLGLIAQEVEQVIPEVVTPPASEDAFYAMSYDDLIPVLINAIKELEARVAELESEKAID